MAITKRNVLSLLFSIHQNVHSLSCPCRVLMLGDTAVGKSSLVSQFMTSEYLHAYDTSIGKFHWLTVNLQSIL